MAPLDYRPTFFDRYFFAEEMSPLSRWQQPIA
jgi:hypothetical protein